MARVSEGDVDRARVQTWAAWRREGKSYEDITALDTLGPSYPTIKRYLEKYGFDGDGQPVEKSNGSGPDDDWGEIQTGVRLPGPGTTSKYDQLMQKATAVLGERWARVPAPTTGAARYFGHKLREETECEIAVRTVDDQVYLYFRQTPSKNGSG